MFWLILVSHQIKIQNILFDWHCHNASYSLFTKMFECYQLYSFTGTATMSHTVCLLKCLNAPNLHFLLYQAGDFYFLCKASNINVVWSVTWLNPLAAGSPTRLIHCHLQVTIPGGWALNTNKSINKPVHCQITDRQPCEDFQRSPCCYKQYSQETWSHVLSISCSFRLYILFKIEHAEPEQRIFEIVIWLCE